MKTAFNIFYCISILTMASGQVESEWTQTKLSVEKAWMGSAVSGTKAYFAGGFISGSVSDIVEIYDATSDTWSYEKLSIARGDIEGIAAGSKIIFAGGTDIHGSIITNVDIFDTLSKQWTLCHLSKARIGMSPATVGNKVLFAGGNSYDLKVHNWVPSDIVDVYNFENEQWSTMLLSEPRIMTSSASFEDLAFFAGGLNHSFVSDRIDIYNAQTDVWSTATLSEPRFYIQSVTIDNKVIFAGGLDKNAHPSKRVDIYNLKNNTWSIDSLSVARAFDDNNQNAAVACGKAYFTGGMFRNQISYLEGFTRIDIYDSASNIWSTDELPYNLFAHSVVSVHNKLLITGGFTLIPGQSFFERHNTVLILTCSPLDSDDFIANHPQINIYPNPASDQLFIQISQYHEGKNLRGSIKDKFGNAMNDVIFHSDVATINVSVLTAGYYIIEITDGEQTFRKIILVLR
ncbi:MAG: T9SS type A sorting domain-containing protein [Saprospiraceae bacterium]|nr:T9SS type A sorting domain-containing protein [Saprospiraceae bacterium]